jgi:hypothetical protein
MRPAGSLPVIGIACDICVISAVTILSRSR